MISIDKPELEFKPNYYLSPVNTHKNTLVNRDIFKIYNIKEKSNKFNNTSNKLLFTNNNSNNKDDEIEQFFKDFRKDKESVLSKYGKKNKFQY